MDKAELLSTFKGHVEHFERYQGFIEKARKSGGKFAAAVVEKVITDNEAKTVEVVAILAPLQLDMDAVIAELGAQRQKIIDGRQDSEFKLQELELRREIGDLSEQEFALEAAEFKAVVDSTDAKVTEIDAESEEFEALVKRWRDLAERAGVFEEGFGEVAVAAAPAPVPEPEIEIPDDEEDEPEEEDGPAIDEDDDEEDDEPEIDIGDDEPMGSGLVSDDGGIGGDDVFGEADGGDFEIGDLDILPDDDDLDLDQGGDDGSSESRRAVLLYQEGTAEEQIYPFNGEVMSLGRGRDNDVQVKNDSKVSRYHCKLYRRGPNFYIEDNKSANGSLVNGELITERRLFGGEEVIIGETFFRFRILD